MSQIFDLSQSMNHDGSSNSSSWLDAGLFDADDIMSSLNASQDYIDINDLLDVGNASDVIQTPVSCSLCINGDYADDVAWCTEHLELRSRLHQSQIDYQNKQLAEENEAGLMEALQSMEDQFECGVLLDMFPTNYNFQQADSFPLMGSTSPVTVDVGQLAENEEISLLSTPLTDEVSNTSKDSSSFPPEDEKADLENESMLKQLLLNPHQNYPKEIDSGNNGTDHNSSEPALPKASICSGDLTEDKKLSRKMKRKKKIAKKPFTELLKHLENPKSQKSKGQAKPTSKLVNVNRYMRQYCSAPPSRVASPVSDTGNVKAKKDPVGKTPSVQTSVSSKNLKAPLVTASSTGKKSHVTKVYPIVTSSTILKSRTAKESERVIVAPDADSLLDMFEVERSQSWNLNSETDGKSFGHSADKRRGTVLIDPLPKKRLRSNEDTKKTNAMVRVSEAKQCTERPSADHDYCQHESSKSASDHQDLLSAVIQASGLASTESSDCKFEVPASKPPCANKVLKWEEYLQRVRLGTRSAPNSPTTSPKIVRGAARPVNNFMVTTSTGVVKQKPSKPVAQLVDPIAAIKTQTKVQNPIKLQEFQEYLAKLQNGQQVNATSTSPAGLNNVTGKILQVTQSPISITPATVAVAMSPCRPMVQQSRPIAPSQPFIKIHSGGKVHTAAVTSSQTSLPANKPLVMIRIPTGSSSTSVVGLPCVTTTQKPSGPKTVLTAVSNQVLSANNSSSQQKNADNVSVSELIKDPRISAKKAKPLPTVLKPISREKWNSTKTAPKPTLSTKPKAGGNPVGKKTSDSSPTFKLITSNKGGVETKSLILSGVTGQLKEILTLLAQQQQQQGKVNEQKETSNLQQQKTLQQLLLATITNMKSKQPGAAASSNSSSVVNTRAMLNASNVATTSRVQPTVKAVKKNLNVPSPLSLIHEIKQNMSKKNETTKPSTPKHQDTAPAAATSRRLRSRSRSKSAINPVTEPPAEEQATLLESLNKASVAVPQSVIPPTAQDQPVVSSQQPQSDTTSCRLSYPLPTVLPKFSVDNEVSTALQDPYFNLFVDRPVCSTQLSSAVDSAAAVPSRIPVIIDQRPITGVDKQNKYADDFTQLIVKDTLDEICDSIAKNESCRPMQLNQLSNDLLSPAGMSSPALHETALSSPRSDELTRCPVREDVQKVISHKPEDISIRRSMAAAEMMASDLIESNQEEVLVYTLQQPQISAKIQNNPEEAEALNNTGNDSQYYNKLPAYMYSGKVLNEADTSNNLSGHVYRECSDVHSSRTGLKELSDDPVFGTEVIGPETDIQYNKLPHYLSSGKLGPRESDDFMLGSVGEIAHEVTIDGDLLKKGSGFPTKLKYTPDGNVIDTDDTFYSRLPSYYSYGRTHVVDTVTQPPDEPDDVVTEETLERQQEERKSRREKKKRKKKKRRKHRKSGKRPDADRILYSKLPSYLLSGRRQLAPERGASEHSYSSSRSFSSDSEADSRSRSPLRRRRSYRRSYSPRSDRSISSSRSRSRSPRRSWRSERSSGRGGHGSSQRHERDRYSSESDHRTSRSRYRRRRSSSCESDWGHRERTQKRQKQKKQEQQQTKDEAIRQRRVMYVGGISDDTCEQGLRQRFCKFGEIDDVALHFRTGRDSYAFITFRFSCDATNAIERGNEGDVSPTYVLCYGGRRQFCQVDYADLDDEGESRHKQDDAEDDFDTLLRQAMRRS